MTTAAHPAQYVTLIAAEPPIQVTCLRGDGIPTVTGGYGGWATQARPLKKSLTVWQGIDPYELTIPVLLDGHQTNTSVEGDCGQLERLAGAARAHGEPPLIRIVGAVPHAADTTWVVKTLEWGDPVIYSEDGYRTRQGATLDLLEYVAPDRIQTMGAAEEARIRALAQATKAARDAGVGGSAPAHSKFYVTKSGDTLSSIAARELGDYRRWVEIAEINNIHDPRHVKTGTRLRLP